jgi:putative membrane protein
VGLAVLMALALALRELAGFARMARIDTLRLRAVEAAASANIKEARSVVAGLESLYSARPEFAPARARLAARGAEIFDADGLLSLAEAELMAPLDQSARSEVEAAARQVATVTALVPLALADVATALYANLRMIRRIAAIYGGRSGTLGSLRLMRGVFTHLAATGALAVGDDMIQSVAGGGILSRISRRFGEGVVNGALTARVGVAAMDVCRPLPFRALPRPKTTSLVSRGLAGLFSEGKAG